MLLGVQIWDIVERLPRLEWPLDYYLLLLFYIGTNDTARGNPDCFKHDCMTNHLESRFAERDPGKSCIRKIVASRLRKVILPLCSALVRHFWSPESSTVLPSKERHGHTRVSSAKVNKNC